MSCSRPRSSAGALDFPIASFSLGRHGQEALRLAAVDVVRAQATVLQGVDWVVGSADRWAVLGPKRVGQDDRAGAGVGISPPDSGHVDILGHRLGRVDVRRLRPRIGVVSAAVAKMLLPNVTAQDIVMSARHAALEPWWHHYDSDDRSRAAHRLADAGSEARFRAHWRSDWRSNGIWRLGPPTPPILKTLAM